LADEAVVFKLPCGTFTCTKVEIVKWREHATTANVTSVKDSTGAEAAAGDAKRQDAINGALAKDDASDSPEKHWPKAYVYDCPGKCRCPEAAMTWTPEQDVDQEVELPITLGSGGTATVYTVTIKIKATRKVGTAKCV
jgi:hypothetical protein